MDEDFPNEFDLVVIGTGFSESIVAAAASRIGKTVLHLDSNEFYGGTWASFNLEAFQNFLNNSTKTDEDDEINFKITENYGVVGVKQNWHIECNTDELSSSGGGQEDSKQSDSNDELWTKEKIIHNFRKFNIDLVPKILFAGGKLVELLISSNICRYAEFRAVDKICTIFNDEVKNVPCSRNDVFNSTDLNIIEKRLLMKLLTNCMNYAVVDSNEDKGQSNVIKPGEEQMDLKKLGEEFNEYEGKTFLEYLKGQKLTDKIIHCVLHAISMCDEDTPLKEGIEKTKKFLNSLGRYGNTPFLFPMYGCGEIPQDFCRLCAVFGGIYCLKRSIEDMTVVEDDTEPKNSRKKKIAMIKCNEQNIKVENLVVGSNNIPNGLITGCCGRKPHCGGLSRAVFITSTPIGPQELNSGGGGVNIMRLSGEGDSAGAFIIQLSHYSGTCPKGLYLIHVTSQSKTDSAETDLAPFILKIFKENSDQSPKRLYSAYFTIPRCKNCKVDENNSLIFSNVYMTCGPFFELDYDQSVANAVEIFKQLYPNDEFLPRAPDPEEIVFGDEDPTAVNEQSTEIDEKSIMTEIEERIKEIQDGNENNEKCLEENTKNEEKDTTK